MDNGNQPKHEKENWKSIYIIGGIAAFLAVLVFRRFLAVELMAFNGLGIFQMPQIEPTSALEWFTILENNQLIGLILLGLVDMINYLLVGLIFLAMYGALRKTRESVMELVIVLSIVSISIFIASNQALGLLKLSNQYHATISDPQRSIYLAAGEALSVNIQGMGWYVSLFLIYLAGLIISIVMLLSNIFNKATAWIGILANGFGLLLFPTLLFAPAIIWLPPSLSAPFRVTWYVLIALKLFKLAREK